MHAFVLYIPKSSEFDNAFVNIALSFIKNTLPKTTEIMTTNVINSDSIVFPRSATIVLSYTLGVRQFVASEVLVLLRFHQSRKSPQSALLAVGPQSGDISHLVKLFHRMLPSQQQKPDRISHSLFIW